MKTKPYIALWLIAAALFALVSGLAWAGTVSPYQLVQAIPSTFPANFSGVRDLYQDHVMVRTTPGWPAPTGVKFTGPQGQVVTLPIVSAQFGTNGWWMVSTGHMAVFWPVDGVGSVRLVEPSNALSVGFVP